MNIPQISIIVPVYNAEKYLHKCITSILSQTFSNIEVLLIDDGSIDNSGLICDEYAAIDTRIRVIHKDNGGVSSARNVGIENAKGEWITFVDSDDWIVNTMYEEMYQTAMLDNADVVYCDINMIYADSNHVWAAASLGHCKEEFLNNFISSTWTSLCNVLAKRIIFEKNQIRSPEYTLYCEDYHVVTRVMYYATKISHINKPLYCYNRINESSTMNNFTKIYSEGEYLVNVDMINFFKAKGLYDVCAESLNWRYLRSVRNWVWDSEKFDKFRLEHTDSHNFIWTCPYINNKLKIMMWLLSRRLKFIARFILFSRIVYRRLSGWCVV